MSPPPLRYGRAHQRRRVMAWWTLPRVCRFCGEPIEAWEPWHLDHLLGREGGDWGPVALAHARCNLADGASRAKAARWARRIERHLAAEAELAYWMEVNAARVPSPPPPPRPMRTPRIH